MGPLSISGRPSLQKLNVYWPFMHMLTQPAVFAETQAAADPANSAISKLSWATAWIAFMVWQDIIAENSSK